MQVIHIVSQDDFKNKLSVNDIDLAILKHLGAVAIDQYVVLTPEIKRINIKTILVEDDFSKKVFSRLVQIEKRFGQVNLITLISAILLDFNPDTTDKIYVYKGSENADSSIDYFVFDIAELQR